MTKLRIFFITLVLSIGTAAVPHGAGASTPPPYTPDAPPAPPAPSNGICVRPTDEPPTANLLAAPRTRFDVVLLPLNSSPLNLPKSALLRVQQRAEYAYIPLRQAKEYFRFLHASVLSVSPDRITLVADPPGRCMLTLHVGGAAEIVSDANASHEPVRFTAFPPLLAARNELLIPMRLVSERFGATVSWRQRNAAKHAEVAYVRAVTTHKTKPTYRLEIAPPQATATPGAVQSYALTLRQLTPKTASTAYPEGTVTVPPEAGYATQTTVHVSATAAPASYPVDPVPAAGEKRKIVERQRAILTVVTPSPSVQPVVVSCHWEAKKFVQALDGSRVPDLNARPVYVGQPAPAVTPAPTFDWNPIFPIDAKGRIHAHSEEGITSLITISGGGCAPVRVAFFLYGDGFVPQRNVAIDYGRAGVYDELSPGNVDWRKYLVHAEIEAPLSVRGTQFSLDARSIGYRHDAASTIPLACPPKAPAPAPGGAPAGDEGCVTLVGGASQTYRTGFNARDDSVELRAGLALVRHGPVAEIGYLRATNNAGRPNVDGFGIALEVPPLLEQTVAGYGSISYYPSLSGGGIRYNAVRYRAGATLSLTPLFARPYFFEFAVVGDRRSNVARAPSSAVYQAFTLGAGIRF